MNITRKLIVVWHLLAMAIVATALRSDACASDEVVAMLASARAQEREAGLRLLLASGSVPDSAFPALYGVVSRADDNAVEQRLVDDIIVSIGETAGPVLLNWSRDQNATVRYAAARSFARLGTCLPDRDVLQITAGDGVRSTARDALRTMLQDEDGRVRLAAATAFATNVSPKNAVEELATVAKDVKQPAVIRAAAAAALVRTGDDGWLKFLLDLSLDDCPQVRGVAYLGLARAGQADSLIKILSERGEQDPDAASDLCYALATTQSKKAAKALQEVLDAARAGQQTRTAIQDLFVLENCVLAAKGLPPNRRGPPFEEMEFREPDED